MKVTAYLERNEGNLLSDWVYCGELDFYNAEALLEMVGQELKKGIPISTCDEIYARQPEFSTVANDRGDPFAPFNVRVADLLVSGYNDSTWVDSLNSVLRDHGITTYGTRRLRVVGWFE